MSSNLKKLSIVTIASLSILLAPVAARADIQCPNGWAREVHGVAEVCVAQNQSQSQSQTQRNNQHQDVNQNVNINTAVNTPAIVPQVVYQAQARVTELPRTGLPEAGLALSALLPAGFILKKYAFKKSEKKSRDSAAAIWLEKNS